MAESSCYAVIFSSQRGAADPDYDVTAQRMLELAQQQPGFLAFETARGEDGFGITVSYWDSLEAIANWRRQAEHRLAQERGRSDWYRHYTIRIARVERVHEWHVSDDKTS